MVAKVRVVLVLVATAATSWAGPLNKRIAQTISASTAKWEQACQAAGGDQQCNPLSQTAFMTLLAAAGPCEQQDAGDQMIDLAKQLNNDADMIKFTQIFVQQPRNTPDSFQIPYCQQAPRNAELNGLFQCQFEGTKDTFVGDQQVGAEGTIPFGLDSLDPPRSCPANPQGGIADGTQLVDLTEDPGVSNANSGDGSDNNGSNSNGTTSEDGSNNSNTGASSVAESSAVETPAATGSAADSSATGTADATNSAPSSASSADPSADPSCNIPSSSSGDTGNADGSVAAAAPPPASGDSFLLQNGQDAQSLNAEFQSLNENSPCETGDTACIGSSFALCNNGSFQLMDCGAAAGNTCAALPLVNNPGTTVTCVSQDEAIQRIESTGATGGLTGSG